MHAMTLSRLSYCILCWGQAGETAAQPLESLYKQTEHLAKSYYIFITVGSRRNAIYRALGDYLWFGPISTTGHTVLYILLEPREDPPYEAGPYHLKHTAFGQSAFSGGATTQWNSLSVDVRSCGFNQYFHIQLKKLLKTSQLCTFFPQWSL